MAPITNQSGGSISGYEGVRVKYAAMTVVNAGTISGATFAVQLAGGYTNRLVVDPGAVFNGLVDGGNGSGSAYLSTLELAGTTPGTLSGIGTNIFYFYQTTVDSGASWSLTNVNTFVRGGPP